MNAKECFIKWRGEHPWSSWTKPTLFAQNFNLNADPALPSARAIEFSKHLEGSLAPNNSDSCLILDLQNEDSIHVAIKISHLGYCPVPIFNGVMAPWATPGVLDNSKLQAALLNCAGSLSWPLKGGPAFLLDARRMYGAGDVGNFDNRWITMPQDYPSGESLKKSGIKRCFLVFDNFEISTDLIQVLYRWQDTGMEIFAWNRDQLRFDKFLVQKPGWLKRLFYRMKVTSGLYPSVAGGFGAIVGSSSGG